MQIWRGAQLDGGHSAQVSATDEKNATIMHPTRSPREPLLSFCKGCSPKDGKTSFCKSTGAQKSFPFDVNE